MNYVSLFSGIGGFDLALDRAGHNCVAQVEKDKACRVVLAKHWPGVPRFDDVITFSKDSINEPVDIVCGGSPCQSFSVAGLRRSLDDSRGNLAFEFVRICNELQPRYVIWENVPGVLSTKDNAFGCFLAGLVGETAPIVPHGGRWTNAGVVAGPERAAAWRILDAQYFGVAQRRRRVFVVASAGNYRCAEILFEREGVRRDSAPRRETRESVAGTVAEGIDVRNSRSQGNVSGTLQAKKTGGYSLNYQNPVAIYQFASGGDDDLKDSAQALRAGAEEGNPEVVGGTPSRKIDMPEGELFEMREAGRERRSPQGRGLSEQLTGELGAYLSLVPQPRTHATWFLLDLWKAAEGIGLLRKALPEVQEVWRSAHVQAQSAHPVATVRRLTPTEAERLQAFPDGHTADQADTPRYKQLGNAVCVNVVEWIARRIPT